MQQYGVLISSTRMGINTLVIEHEEPYRTPSIHLAIRKARDKLLVFCDRSMITSIVPLNDDNTYGLPISRYQLNDNMEVAKHSI